MTVLYVGQTPGSCFKSKILKEHKEIFQLTDTDHLKILTEAEVLKKSKMEIMQQYTLIIIIQEHAIYNLENWKKNKI